MILPEPSDFYAEVLSGWTRPCDWRNPPPAPRYNLVVIGGGPAGLVCAAGAAGLGAKVALIEKYRLGGDCLHFGCVPSKSLIRAGAAANAVRKASTFGLDLPASRVDFAAMMERLRRTRAIMGEVDSASRFARMGVDVFFGPAKFSGPDSVSVGDAQLRFSRAVIATGATAKNPDLPGFAEGSYFTNETIFNLTELPRRLVVLGAGPMGCELSQAFARLGSEVHLVSRSSSILPREEPEASRVVHDRLTRDGVICHLGVRLKHGIDRGLVVEKDGLEMAICGEAILVATGRRANVDGLNLLAAEVQCDSNGVIVDDYLRTTNRRIFAAGDVCSKHRFTHAADAMARCVIKNALFLGRSRWSSIIIPHSTYTDPELASVGMNESEAAEKGIAIRTLRVDFRDVDRAVIDDDTDGFAQVHVRSGTDKIIGATIVGATAGELIAEVTLAMAERIGMRKLATVVRPYPTRSLVFSKLADAYQRTRLTPTSARILRWFLRQRR